MAIKEAKQSGSNVLVKCGNSTQPFSGTLIGYTPNAVFIQKGRNLYVLVVSKKAQQFTCMVKMANLQEQGRHKRKGKYEYEKSSRFIRSVHL